MLDPNAPKWLGIEGADGTGKTTQTTRLGNYMKSFLGLDVVVSRAPGGTDIGRVIRQMFMPPENSQTRETLRTILEYYDLPLHVQQCIETLFMQEKKLQPATEELLHSADLRELSETMKETLASGKWGLTDRSEWSSPAFSTWGKGNPSRWEFLFRFAMEECRPSHVVLLKLLDIDEGIKRASVHRPDAITKYDDAGRDFHVRINNAYDTFAEKFPAVFSVVIVDGLTIEETTQAIIQKLTARKVLPTPIARRFYKPFSFTPEELT